MLNFDFMAAPQRIKELVEKFTANFKTYHGEDYLEEDLRHDFLNPFFRELGWDMEDKAGKGAMRDLHYEKTIKAGAPDYGFYTDRKLRFFVEAKNPSVNVCTNQAAALQLRGYGWSAKVPRCILTDFEELSIYDTTVRPKAADQARVARMGGTCIKYTEFVDRWDEIAAIFSREAVMAGSLEKLEGMHANQTVDKELLVDISRWREMLAKNIANRNEVSEERLNRIVQDTIGRILFLRICEDRGIAHEGDLSGVVVGDGTYAKLYKLFKKAEQRYDSDLFEVATIADIVIDDNVLKDVISELFFPKSPYKFDAIPAEILGQVYEQFLGKVIRLTEGGHAKVEEKPEVRKAGGIYYTPTYVVDYIVQNTVGKLVEGKTPKKIETLSVVDPACGSGSFLLGAYKYLADWHRDWYVADSAAKHEKAKKIYRDADKQWQLTLDERKRILTAHIYGVDLDRQAVELAKLSLMLEALRAPEQGSLFNDRMLPRLGDNIKCGNSLIGTDYFSGQTAVDSAEMARINAFDWEAEFKEIFKRGGFDTVIGNPPYVRQETLGPSFKKYAQKFETYAGTADLYAYFIERSLAILAKDGKYGVIVSNKWMRASYGKPLRQFLKKQHIEEITDFGDTKVFEHVTVYTCILTIKKDKPGAVFWACQVTPGFKNLVKFVGEHRYQVDLSSLDDGGWSLADRARSDLLAKLKSAGRPLGEYVDGKIYRGVLTGLNEAFVIDEETKNAILKKNPNSRELIKPFAAGRDVKRYAPLPTGRYLILIPDGWTRRQNIQGSAWEWIQKNYPGIAGHLEKFAEACQKRYDKGEHWWELRACAYYDEFEKPKITIPALTRDAAYTHDQQKYYSNDKTAIIPTEDYYLLGLLNSKAVDFYMHSISAMRQGGFYEYKPMYLAQLPIRIPASDEEKTAQNLIVKNVEEIIRLNVTLTKTDSEDGRTAIQRQIDATDHKIDVLVYKLYRLTDEEVRIVEGLKE